MTSHYRKAIMVSEQTRRNIIRLATAILIGLVGPAGAWRVGGLNGLLVYFALHMTSKYSVAEFSSSSGGKRALNCYRISPALLLLAGLTPLIPDQILPAWDVKMVLVPLLLGGFEGAFWSTFHDIRIAVGRGVDEFQASEVIATIVAAGMVLVIGENAGLLGGVLACVALLIPFGPETNKAVAESIIGSSTSELDSVNALKAGNFTGSFGMMQISTGHSMKLVSLPVGGIDLLTQVVAVSTSLGWLFERWNDNRIKKKYEGDNLTKDELKLVAAPENWIIGNYGSLLGIALMIAGIGYVSEDMKVFLAGYTVVVGTTYGILKSVDIKIADFYLRGEGGTIGLRERLKFRAMMKLVFVFSIVWLALNEIYQEPTVDWILYSALIWAALCAMANLHNIKDVDSLLAQSPE
ncbi:MAG: hypothetical protein VYD41_00585 [Candidatus Thermoplasmatota archaeon]|nr:hypothetical protein [Candidatus Thermoplasmatota archaeon]